MSLNTQHNYYNLWNSQSAFYAPTTQQLTVSQDPPSQPPIQDRSYADPEFSYMCITTTIQTIFNNTHTQDPITFILTEAEKWAKAGNREKTLKYLHLLQRFVLDDEKQRMIHTICQWIDCLEPWLVLLQNNLPSQSVPKDETLALYFAELEKLYKNESDTQVRFRCIENALQGMLSTYKSLPSYWTWWYQRARLYEKQSNIDTALYCYSRCLKARAGQPSHLKIHLALTYMYYSNASYQEGDNMLQKVLHTLTTPRSTHRFLYPYLLRLYFLFGTTDNVKNMINHALKAHPEAWYLWSLAIQLHIHMDEQKEAENLIDAALNKFSDKSRLYLIKAQVNYKRKPEKELIVIIEEGLRAIPKSGELYCELARFYLNPLSSLFNLDTASELLQKALKLTPQYGDTYIEMLRCTILKEGFTANTEIFEQQCHFAQKASYGMLWDECAIFPSSIKEKLADAKEKLKTHLLRTLSLYPQYIGHTSYVGEEELTKKEWRFEELLYAFPSLTPCFSCSRDDYRQKTKFCLEQSLNSPEWKMEF